MTGLFGQIALVVWRESMEALLVVGILNAWLAHHADRASARTGRRFLWIGVATGLAAAALLAAVMLGFARLLEGDREDLFQIAVAGIAATLILHMVAWMHRRGSDLQKNLVHGAERAMSQRNWWGLLLLAALAVAREGSETVVFLYGILASMRGTNLSTCLAAMAAGFAAAGALYWLLQLGARRISWRLFFRVTEILLLFLAASLLMTALDRAIGIDLVPPLSRPMWDTSWLFDDMAGLGGFISAMTGYRARPELASVLVYALYWLTAGALLFPSGPQARRRERAVTIRIVPDLARAPVAAPPPDIWSRIGEGLKRHQRTIRAVQWSVVSIYAVLLIVPVFLPLPGNMAFLWTDFTRFAQFAFWGVWWPFVLLSTALVGRVWCGLLCPEGAISEFASAHGRAKATPRWMTWPGWPTLAFACTTLYGQMISVYQYPRPALLILGGSTAVAATVGYLFGRNKRVWCRYLCPVSGVFALLAKLAPLHFRVDLGLWQQSQLAREKPGPVNCAPLVPLRTMRGASDCHMCGRCSGFRGAIRLARRSPNHEIVHVAGQTAKPWETVLIVFGLMGLALGAFQWSASPWFVAVTQWTAARLVEAGVTWPLDNTAPWWLLTNYPERNDVLTLLDGTMLVAYVVAVALGSGAATISMLFLSARCLGSWNASRFHHLAQALIPLAGAGVFLGLSSLTVSQLRSDDIIVPFVGEMRAAVLVMAAAWSAILCWRITALYTSTRSRQAITLSFFCAAMLPCNAGWFLLFAVW